MLDKCIYLQYMDKKQKLERKHCFENYPGYEETEFDMVIEVRRGLIYWQVSNGNLITVKIETLRHRATIRLVSDRNVTHWYH